MSISIKIEFKILINKIKQLGSVDNEPHEEKPQLSCDSFLERAEREIDILRKDRSPSTIENYLTALRSLRRFLGEEYTIQQLNAELIGNYERWLHVQHVSTNTISCYMRSIRSLAAIMDGDEVKSLFHKVFTGHDKTDKRSISEQKIQAIQSLQLPPNTFISLVRDLFMFSFYSLGMPFVDMAFLRKQNIRNGTIVYFRHKTGQRITIPIEPCILHIINRYISSSSEYVFPLLTSTAPDIAYKEYLSKLNRYNRGLKKLSSMAGVSDLRLTSYVSRHSWASMMYAEDAALSVISKGLGHANPRTTQIYISEIDDDRLAQANRKLLKKLDNNEKLKKE
jgi:integrase